MSTLSTATLRFFGTTRALQSRFSSCLEVERKFVPSTTFVQEMNAMIIHHNENTKDPAQCTWSAKEDLNIRDTYYDLDNKLYNKGLWIRFRSAQFQKSEVGHAGLFFDGEWNAKIRLGGDFINSSFEEVQGEAKVRALLAQHLPHLSLEDLGIMADLSTIRRTWVLSQRGRPTRIPRGDEGNPQYFSIVLDRVKMARAAEENGRSNFEHEIGEVEMTRSLSASNASERCHEDREVELEAMHEQIRYFMANHQELFSSESPRGKLSAYFDWQKRAQ